MFGPYPARPPRARLGVWGSLLLIPVAYLVAIVHVLLTHVVFQVPPGAIRADALAVWVVAYATGHEATVRVIERTAHRARAVASVYEGRRRGGVEDWRPYAQAIIRADR